MVATRTARGQLEVLNAYALEIQSAFAYLALRYFQLEINPLKSVATCTAAHRECTYALL